MRCITLLGIVALLGAFGSGGCDSGDRGSDKRGEARDPVTPALGDAAKEGERPSVSRAEQESAYLRERERMVHQLRTGASDVPIVEPRVLDALLRVPRHEFVPTEVRSQSYDNTPLPIHPGQTITQPYIVALMTQLLELKGTERVLEVGTGSGYQAAVLGELAGEVVTVEILPELLVAAKKRLEDLKARGVLRYRKLEAVLGDGSKGYVPAAPYDAIIVTAAPTKVPVDLLNQLKPGGRLVIPVGGDYIQNLQLILKKPDGTYDEQSVVPVRFVPLVSGETARR